MLAICCVSWCAETTLGQDDPPIKVNTVLLNVPVFVSDKNGRPVSGLSKEDFELTVREKKQKIDFFVDKGPIAVAILIDSNSNTRDVLDRIKRDAQRFIDLLEPQDNAMVIRFDGGYKVMCELTSDRDKLRRAVGKIESYQYRIRAMDKVLHQVIFLELAGVKGRKAIIILGDPDSAVPWYSNPEYLSNSQNFLPESDVAVYPIFYKTTSFPRKFEGTTLTIDQLVHIPPVDNYNSYAVLTGGRLYASDANDFKTAFQQIVDEIRNQYVLSFHVDSELGYKGSNVSIKMARQNLNVRAKQKVKTSAAEERKKLVSRYMIGRLR